MSSSLGARMHQDFDLYKLSASDHEAIYQDIRESMFSDNTPMDYPTAVILGGQPGSGKSIVLDRALEDFPDRNAVVINGDDFRKWHPDSRKIITLDEANYARLTDLDVREWTRRLFADAVESKRSIVFESTMRTPEPIASTMRNMVDHQYTTIARVLAVHRFESIAGVFTRFERQKADHGHGRMAPIPVHDEAYTGLLLTLDAIQDRKCAHCIQVLSRDNEMLLDTQSFSGDWSDPQPASEAVSSQRNKPISLFMANRLVTTWEEVGERLQARNARPGEIETTASAYLSILNEIAPVLLANPNLAERAASNHAMAKVSKLLGLETKRSVEEQAGVRSWREIGR